MFNFYLIFFVSILFEKERICCIIILSIVVNRTKQCEKRKKIAQSKYFRT